LLKEYEARLERSATLPKDAYNQAQNQQSAGKLIPTGRLIDRGVRFSRAANLQRRRGARSPDMEREECTLNLPSGGSSVDNASAPVSLGAGVQSCPEQRLKNVWQHWRDRSAPCLRMRHAREPTRIGAARGGSLPAMISWGRSSRKGGRSATRKGSAPSLGPGKSRKPGRDPARHRSSFCFQTHSSRANRAIELPRGAP